MRRLCISFVIVPSLLIAAAPAQSLAAANHRQQARGGAPQAHVTTSTARARTTTRPRTAKRAHKYTYGRT